jgi:simple sugar transport system permease protein
MDLSIGACANFADTLIMTMFVWYNLSMGFSIILTILVCLTIAVVNSLLIVKLRIPDMVAALSVMFIFQGVALTYSNGGAITERMMRPDGTQAPGLVPEAFRAMGAEPLLIIIMLCVVALAHFFLNYTKHGRYMYAVGGNREAAKLSGIPVAYRCGGAAVPEIWKPPVRNWKPLLQNTTHLISYQIHKFAH